MDTRNGFSETRVLIDQGFELGDSTESQNGKNSGSDLRISMDQIGALNNLNPVDQTNTFPRAHAVTFSTAGLSQQLPTSIITQKAKSRSSVHLPVPMLSHTLKQTSASTYRITTPTKLPFTHSEKPRSSDVNESEGAPLLNHSTPYSTMERTSLRSPPSPDELTCDSGMDDLSMVEEDRLRLHAACLEGRLSVYGREADTWLRERTELSVELASLRKKFEVSRASQREIEEQTNQRVTVALSKSREAQASLLNTKQELAAKLQEAERLESDLKDAQQESTSLRTQLADAQQNSSAKEQAITSLKEKLSQLYADLEGFRNAHEQALDSQTDLNAELMSLRRSQEWYSEQLQLTQAARERLQNELNSMRRWLDQGGSSAQQLAQENARLETQVLSSEAALAEAKRNLSRQLEAIRADIVEREAIFEKITAERSSLESLCVFKSNQITELQNRLSSLQGDLSESEAEISSLRASLDVLRQTLHSVESDRDDLRITLSSLEAQVNLKKAQMDDQIQQYQKTREELTHLEGNCHTLNETLGRSLEEKAVLEVSLQTAYKEREGLDLYLNQLKEDMSRVEANLNNLYEELESKNSEVNALVVVRNELSGDLEVLQETLKEKIDRIFCLENEKEQLQNTCHSFQEENKGLRDDIKNLQATIEPACEEAASKAREPLNAELESVNTLSEALKNELTGFREQVNNLLAEQELHCVLITRHQELQKQYNDLQEVYATSVDQAKTKEAELAREMEQAESTYSQNLLTKSSQIDALTKELGDKSNEISCLQSELDSAKAQHQEALSRQSNEWASRLSELEFRLQAAESRRSDLENQLQGVVEREGDAVTKHRAEIADLRAEVSKFEARAAQADILEDKQRKLLADLETTRGRELGLSDTIEGLRRHAEHLKTALHHREADVVELNDRAEKAAAARPIEAELEPLIAPIQTEQQLSACWQQLLPCSTCTRLTSDIAWHTETASRAQEELSKAQAALELMRQELGAQLSKTANETFARQKANEAKRGALGEVERLKREVAEIKEALEEAKNAKKVAEADALSLKDKAKANDHSDSSEVQALQSIIQAMTNHLDALKKELADTKQEAWESQAGLSEMRGALRGLIERSRLFDSHTGALSVDSAGAVDGAAAAAVYNHVEASELEKLLADRTNSLLKSKPLLRVNNYLDLLHQEIDSLENQVIHHASVVRESVANWRSIEEQAVLIRSQNPNMITTHTASH